MKHKVLAIYDRALDAYLRPFTAPALGAAIRSFQDELNRSDSEMNKHPDDYDLHHLADWDDSNGQFVSQPKPISVAIGKQLISKT